MKHKVGVWIDHKQAIIVIVTANPARVQIVESEVGPHGRYSGRSSYPNKADKTKAARGERKHEARFNDELDHYYDRVISELEPNEAILILGPGEAKLELKERISRSKSLSERVVGIETADKLTEAQLIVKVKKYFGDVL